MSNWIEGYPKEIGLYWIVNEDDEIEIARTFDVYDYYSDGSMAYCVIGDEQYYQASSIKRYKILEVED